MNGQKQKIEAYLLELLGEDFEYIPRSMVDFWERNYNKELDHSITDQYGKTRIIDRVLTMDSAEEVSQTTVSWRHNSGPEELDYSVPYLESVLPNWEENDELIPIMGIETKDSAEFDLVVINLRNKRNPAISIWIHEESADEAVLIDIADNCDDFIARMAL